MTADPRRCTLGDLCDDGAVELQTGPFGSQLHAHDYVPDGVPVVPTEAVRERRIDHLVLPHISREKANELARHRLRRGDILFARRGVQATGHIAIVRDNEEGFVCGTGAIRLRVASNGSDVDPDFLSHLLADSSSVAWFKFHAIGATMPNLNEGIIRSFPVTLPDLREQRRIAHLLGALDDKIELNRRMNATLEAMARALFQSWFVDFDPVRAKLDGGRNTGLDDATNRLFPASFEHSEIAPTPSGWAIAPLPDVISVNPPRSLRSGAVAPYLDMKGLPTAGPTAEGVTKRVFTSGTRFQNGDTLLARITPCLENGKTGFVDFLADSQIGWGSTEFIVLAPNPPLPPEFGYLLARSEALRSHAIQNMTGTSGRQRVPSDCFRNFLIAVPPREVALRFGEVVEPLMRKIKANAEQSRTLAALRDTLLPKLLSGEIRVKS